MELAKLIGQKVTLSGIANNAKSGAVLNIVDEYVIYIKDFNDWPPELLNKKISVSGFLKLEKFIPDPKISKNGSISSGATGNQFVLETIKYKKIQ